MVRTDGRESQSRAKSSQLVDYAYACLAVLLVWVGRSLLSPLVGTAIPLLGFVLSVTVAAYTGGLGPGLFACLLSAVAGTRFFLEEPNTVAHRLSVVAFLTVGTVISIVCDRLRRETSRAADNEERFRLLVEGAAETAIYALSPSGKIVSWNNGAERVKGYAAHEILGSHMSVFYTDEDRAGGAPEAALRTAAERGSCHEEGWRVRKDGSRIWVEVALTALRTEDGGLRGFSNITRDVTEAKRNETALTESEQAMRSLMESAAQGIIAINREGRIVLANAMAEQLFGYSRQELRGSPIEMLIPARLAGGHVAQRDGYFDAPRNRPMGMGLPLSALRKDGSEFPVEISLSTIQTRQGQLAVSFITDITGRRAAEKERENLAREIADERTRLRAVLEHMPVGVILGESPGPKLVLHNPEAERLLGHPIVTPTDADTFGVVDHKGQRLPVSEYPLYRALELGETINHVELRYRRGDRKLTVLSASAAPILDSNGNIVSAVTAFTDISNQKTAELERERLLAETRHLNRFLEHSNEDLRQFAYAASHDLQEPLRMVTSYTQLLRRRYGNHLDANAHQYIDYAVSGALRIENLLRGLRDYWQVSEVTGRDPAWTDCNSVLDKALQNLEAAISEAGAVITRDPLPTVLADETPLLQLFQNLISNALKYKHPDRTPTVHIRATADAGEWIFSVRDNGIGIDPRYARQVFGIFKRLNGYRYSGAGMGLAICQKIVERFGGRIWVESELGEGATFIFTIPSAGDPSQGSPARRVTTNK